jgi:integrase
VGAPTLLTDTQIKRAKAGEKDQKLFDSGGLYLFVSKTGHKSWRLKYRFGGKEKRLTFGAYPEVTLVEARDRRDSARKLLRDHIDPAVEQLKRRVASAASAEATFEKIARAWHDAQTPRWSPDYAALVLRALERDVLPHFGRIPIKDIDAPLVLATLRKIEARGSIETAKRVRQHVSAVFVYGISEGICSTDPAALVGKALKPIPKKGRQPSIVDGCRTPEEGLAKIHKLLVDVDGSSAGPATKLASRLLALTAARPGIIRRACWSEFEGIDWTNPDAPAPGALWRVPAAKMKLELARKDEEAFEHVMPLARQAVEVLHAMRRLTSRIALLFPSIRSTHQPMSENAIGYLYNRLGYQGRHVPHGWRTAFSTIMNERARDHGKADDRAVVDLMLAHVPTGLSGSEAAYNRASHMGRRREIAQEWADLITAGLVGADEMVVGRDR